MIALVALQMERRARLRKLIAGMDEDEKAEKLGKPTPPLVWQMCSNRWP